MKKEKEILRYSSLLQPRKRKKVVRKGVFEALKPAEGAITEKHRIGRGRSSGSGKTSGKGQKGQKSRQGYHQKEGFEGGQFPLYRRLRKRGFTNVFKKDYQTVNLWSLVKAKAAGTVGPTELKKLGLVSDPTRPIKILGTGEVTSALSLTVDAVSGSARKKIESAGGSIAIRPGRKPAPPKVKKAKKPA